MLTPLKKEVLKVDDLSHEARRFRTIVWSFQRNLELLFKDTGLSATVDHAALADAYKRTFFALRSDGALDAEPLYEGIAEAITALDADGWLLGVATGKSDRGLLRVLDHHGLRHHFVTLQTADRHPSKPHPSMLETAMAEAGAAPETTVMIGDTSFDMQMAAAAGAHALGVAWGYHPPEELMAAGAAQVVGHARQIPPGLAQLIEGVR